MPALVKFGVLTALWRNSMASAVALNDLIMTLDKTETSTGGSFVQNVDLLTK